MLGDIKYRHRDIERVAHQVNGDHHLEKVLEEHPCIDVMHVVLFRQHGDQFITQNEGDDHACDRQDDRTRQVLYHAENAAVPALRGLPNLRRDLARFLIHIGEHGLQVGRHHGCQKSPHPFFDRFEYRIEHGLFSPFRLAEQSGQLRHQLGTDQDHTAAGHQLLDSLALCAGIVVAIPFEKVNDSPYSEACADGGDQGLEDCNTAAEKSHILRKPKSPKRLFLSFLRISGKTRL